MEAEQKAKDKSIEAPKSDEKKTGAKKPSTEAKKVEAAKPTEPKKVEPPKPKSQAVQEMEKISTYNGDTTDRYAWSQSISEVTVQIKVPDGTTSKQCEVKIKPKHHHVKIKGQDVAIIDGELSEKVKVEDSFWNLEDKKYINIVFEKAYEAIWKTVILGD